MTKVDIQIATACTDTTTVYAHELGHSNGLDDHYTEGAGDCSNDYVPPSIMDCPGYTTVQSHDSADMTLQYRSGPFNPDSLSASVQAFNKIRLAWQERSHNERQFRVERYLYPSGSYAFLANAPRDSGSYNNYGTSVVPNSRYCYRLRAEGDFGNLAPFVTISCPTGYTPHSVGTVSGVFNGSTATICAGRISGSGATQYKILTYRYTTGQALSWTINDNTSCYGAVLFSTNLASDYYHFAAAGCNSSGCSDYRDMTNPNYYWTYMPGGIDAGGDGNTNYHSH